jgi:hypothetical protein
MEWWHSGSPRTKKFLVQKSPRKVLGLIFWDKNSILLIDYLPKGQTINTEYYSSLLVQLNDTLKEKRSRKFTNGVLFLHDSVPTHRTLATQQKLAYLGFQYVDHPPYSPDLAPSDYPLFPGLKNFKLFFVLPRRPGWTDNILNFLSGFLPGRAKNLAATTPPPEKHYLVTDTAQSIIINQYICVNQSQPQNQGKTLNSTLQSQFLFIHN